MSSAPPAPPLPDRPLNEAVGARVGRLYENHGRMVLGLCHVLMRDPHEAEDAAQQTFLSAHKGLLRGQSPRDPAAWLATIARNECRGRIRDRMRMPLPVTDEVPSTLADPEELAIEREDLQEALTALAGLPERQREAVMLRSFCGLSYRELASALGTSVPVVETLLFRGRRRLTAAVRPKVAAAHGIFVAPIALRDQLSALIPGFEAGATAAGATGLALAGGAAIAGGAGAGVGASAGLFGVLGTPIAAKLVATATAVSLGVAAAPGVVKSDATPAVRQPAPALVSLVGAPTDLASGVVVRDISRSRPTHTRGDTHSAGGRAGPDGDDETPGAEAPDGPGPGNPAALQDVEPSDRGDRSGPSGSSGPSTSSGPSRDSGTDVSGATNTRTSGKGKGKGKGKRKGTAPAAADKDSSPAQGASDQHVTAELDDSGSGRNSGPGSVNSGLDDSPDAPDAPDAPDLPDAP
jgi:RNA polymerase sigma factor (sigma-70 family)